MEAILLNCSSPATITAGLGRLRRHITRDDVEIGAYANGFMLESSCCGGDVRVDVCVWMWMDVCMCVHVYVL